jgi:D-alanyl-D-alanine carboxypeptidase
MPSPRSARRRLVLLVVLLVAAVTACGGPTSSATASAASPDARSELVDRWRQRAQVPAVVVALDAGGRDLEVHASGSPRRGERARVPLDARFRIASITKTLVATVVLQLVAEGRLRLDTPVRAVLPDAPAEITVRQLLDHTSGLPDHGRIEGFSDGLLRHRDRVWTPAELLRMVADYDHDFPPGTDWSYSNTGYVLLGELVGAVSGRPWAAEVRARILDPLGMRDTWTGSAEPARGAVLPGYGDGDGDGDEEDLETGGPWPALETSEGAAGAVISTAEDLARFGAALFRGRLLPPELLQEMVTPTPFGARNAGYGLGVEVTRPDYRTTTWGNGGFLPGFRSTLQYVPAEDLVVVVLANTSSAAPTDLAELLTRSVRRERGLRAQGPGTSPATTIPVS